MRITAYLKGQGEWLAGLAAGFILINLILLTSTPLAQSLGEIFYLDLLVLIVTGIGIFLHYRRMDKAYKQIRQAMAAGQDIDSLLAGESSVLGLNLLKEALDYKNLGFSQKENDYKQRMNDLKDYLTQTVHDLKVNLAVCEMAAKRLENETEIAAKLLFQIEQMKFRINQALSITRANHYSEDLLSENVDLGQVVKEAIRANTEFFLHKSISIELDLPPYHLVSDQKWIHYIIAQILHNSSKYTEKDGMVTISGREDDRGYYLHIKDNGIGIPAEELGRVFDKGFTGSNGRSNPKSTGLGLYYAKKMADALGIGLQVQSRRGRFTEFILSFYKLKEYNERQYELSAHNTTTFGKNT